MNRRGVLRIAAVLLGVFVCLGSATACRAGTGASVEAVPDSDPLSLELSPLITGWRSSIADRDDKRIVDYALPEFREAISRDLKSDLSSLNKALYFGSASLATFFKRPVQWTVLRHPEFQNAGRGSTICYYDPAALAAMKVEAGPALIRVSEPNAVRCFFVFSADSRWFVSFAFAYDE